MNSKLQELIDHHEIQQLLNEYCNACDRCDGPRMQAVYSDDSWDDHGHRNGRGADFTKTIMEGMRENNSCSHLMGQSTIKVDGDMASSETYFLAVIRARGEHDTEIMHQLGGRYVDRLVRERGAWKIKHRIAVRDWSITLPMDQDWIAQQGLTPGRRTNADPCFAALNIRHSGVPDFTNEEI